MAIQKVDVTVPGGDTPRSANIKINANFSDQTNAASRLVGKGVGNVPEISLYGVAETGVGGMSKHAYSQNDPAALIREATQNGSHFFTASGENSIVLQYSSGIFINTEIDKSGISLKNGKVRFFTSMYDDTIVAGDLYTTLNVTKDANGFLKGASPVVDMYDNKIGLNHDAEQQGGITFEKLGVGDYLVKGSLGFAQEGWHIETPKDTNGNVLVAVVEKQLENNDLSIKAYAKRFDDETGDVVPNLTRPRDIPTGRFISLRLHELPKESPVMPTQNTSADAPAQTNNP